MREKQEKTGACNELTLCRQRITIVEKSPKFVTSGSPVAPTGRATRPAREVALRQRVRIHQRHAGRLVCGPGPRPALDSAGQTHPNACVERFNGSFRCEGFDAYRFTALRQVRHLLTQWMHDYNTLRQVNPEGLQTSGLIPVLTGLLNE